MLQAIHNWWHEESPIWLETLMFLSVNYMIWQWIVYI